MRGIAWSEESVVIANPSTSLYCLPVHQGCDERPLWGKFQGIACNFSASSYASCSIRIELMLLMVWIAVQFECLGYACQGVLQFVEILVPSHAPVRLSHWRKCKCFSGEASHLWNT
jgi:hypothetical protein